MRQHTAGLAIKGIDTGEEFYAQEICAIAVTILLRMEATRFDTLSDISLSRTPNATHGESVFGFAQVRSN